MRVTIDFDQKTLVTEHGTSTETHDIFSKESFDFLAEAWTKIGWVRKYSYGFAWQGRPIIQLPDDMLRIQEAIYLTQPDVIVETGVAHGGSLIFYASLLENIGKGKVIGIDIEIRPHNRKAIEEHKQSERITLVEGSSIDPAIVDQVKSMIHDGDKVMLILDSNHLRDHVFAELMAYADIVTPGCYILAQDGVMEMVAGMPRTEPTWSWDNPISAVKQFLELRGSDFELSKPPRPFDETLETPDCSHHPSGWLIRK